jgi:hypothetical protein
MKQCSSFELFEKMASELHDECNKNYGSHVNYICCVIKHWETFILVHSDQRFESHMIKEISTKILQKVLII